MPLSPGSVVNKVRGIPFYGSSLQSANYQGAKRHAGFGFGNTWFVSSTHPNAANDTSSGHDPVHPHASIDFAVGRCTANNGDVIYVLPGHVETVTAAGGLALDVAGITIIGLGAGASRPKVNFTTATTADMDVNAASITVVNILFTGGIDALVAPIDVNASDFALIDCELRDVTGEVVNGILTDANASRLLIDGYTHDGAAGVGTDAAIAIVGGDGIVISNFNIDGNFAVGGIDVRTTATTDLQVFNGRFRTRNGADIFLVDTITASTGIIGPDLALRLQDNAANLTQSITGATFVVIDPVYVVNAANEKGALITWTASTHA
jgi:hypothetical protein